MSSPYPDWILNTHFMVVNPLNIIIWDPRHGDSGSGRAIARIREIDEADLEQHGKLWLDTKTGDEYRIVTSLVDPGSPGESQVEAFVVRGGMTVYLKPLEAGEQVKVIGAASFEGWQA